jgi:hypothetical protein
MLHKTVKNKSHQRRPKATPFFTEDDMQSSEYDTNMVRECEKRWHNFVWFLFTNVLAAAATLLLLMIFFL